MIDLATISNSELSILIDEWIKGERDRAIMKRRLIDCISYEKLAEEFDLSTISVKKIVYKQRDLLFCMIEDYNSEKTTFLSGRYVTIL